MKYLRSFNENVNRSEIDAICKKYSIKNYNINEDGSIDVDGDADLSSKGLTKLPIKFNKVYGYFDCNDNQLTSLKGAPQSVGGHFKCSYNQLISLEYCPQNVGGNFYCYDNQLTTLKYIPKRINGELDCQNNYIKNIDYLPHYKTLYIIDNPIYKILNLFNSNKDLIFDFKEREIIQKDILIIDRLVEFLEDINKPKSKEYLYDLLKKIYTIR